MVIEIRFQQAECGHFLDISPHVIFLFLIGLFSFSPSARFGSRLGRALLDGIVAYTLKAGIFTLFEI